MSINNELNVINMLTIKNEKLKWNRLHDSMDKLLKKLEPIDNQILKLQAKKTPILDDITELRLKMLDTCIHPKRLLVHNGDHILCKFCDTKLSIPKVPT